MKLSEMTKEQLETELAAADAICEKIEEIKPLISNLFMLNTILNVWTWFSNRRRIIRNLLRNV